MEKAIKKGRGPIRKSIFTEYKEFREAWKKSGKPKYFTWNTKTGGHVYTRKAWLEKRREELRLQIDRVQKRYLEMRVRKLAKQRRL